MYSRAVEIPFRVRSHGFNEKMRQVACVKTKYIFATEEMAAILDFIHTYIHTYFIGSSPRGFSESILHYKIINQVHDNKNIRIYYKIRNR